MFQQDNIILNTDSYKASHWLQYPKGTTNVFSYIESRGGEWKETVFFGLQYFLKEYLSKPITFEMIEEAEAFFNCHGLPFNRDGWLYILREHKGYLPILIKAVPEGMVVPVRNVLVTVENTDPNCFWLTSYIETALLRAVWYPTTVATNSWQCKKIIFDFLKITSDNPENEINFKLHDFGARGVSSFESAGIGGAAHLVNFMGSDTVTGVLFANEYYNSDMAAFSIPAAEHSTITAFGINNEALAYNNMLDNFAKYGKMVAVVSDSYDIYNAVDNIWGKELKWKVIDSGATIIIRPDSGNPVDVVERVVKSLANSFGTYSNNEGYKVLNNVRVIQGDGININMIKDILKNLKANHFSAENIAFGMGGGLLQHLNRDTQEFAMKCSAIKINNEWRDVYKKPITDDKKISKRGVLKLYKYKNGDFVTSKLPSVYDDVEDVLKSVFKNGKILKEYTLDEVRKNATIV